MIDKEEYASGCLSMINVTQWSADLLVIYIMFYSVVFFSVFIT